MSVDFTLLQAFLFWLLGPGAGIFAWGLLKFAQQRSPKIDALSKEYKTYLAIVISIAIACIAYYSTVSLGYLPTPISGQVWLEGYFAVGGASFGLSQIIHAATEKRGVYSRKLPCCGDKCD